MSGRQRASAEGGSPRRRSHSTRPTPHGHWLLGMYSSCSLIIPYKNHEVCKARSNLTCPACSGSSPGASTAGRSAGAVAGAPAAPHWEQHHVLRWRPAEGGWTYGEMHPKHKGRGNSQMLLHYKVCLLVTS